MTYYLVSYKTPLIILATILTLHFSIVGVFAVENVTYNGSIFWVCGYQNTSTWFTKANSSEIVGTLCSRSPLDWKPQTQVLGNSPQYNFNITLNGLWFRPNGGANFNSFGDRFTFNNTLNDYNIPETGSYNLTLNLTSNWVNFTVLNLTVRMIRDIETNDTMNINLNTTPNFILNVSKVGFFQINFSINYTKVNESCSSFECTDERIDVVTYTKSVENLTKFNVTGRYYNILVSNELKNNLQWAYLKFYYNESQLTTSESSLKLGFINESIGVVEVCDSPSGGVDETNNFVYCNTTHFSEWGMTSVSPNFVRVAPNSSNMVSIDKSSFYFCDSFKSPKSVIWTNNASSSTIEGDFFCAHNVTTLLTGQNFNTSINGIRINYFGGTFGHIGTGHYENYNLIKYRFNISDANISSTGTYNFSVNYTEVLDAVLATSYTINTKIYSFSFPLTIVIDKIVNDSLIYTISPFSNSTFNITNINNGYDIAFNVNNTYCGATTNCSSEMLNVIAYNKSVNNITNISITGSFYSILESPTLRDSMKWAYLKFYYNESNITSPESTLRLAWYNSTKGSLDVCDSPNGGVNTIENFVYCNSTHFSEWGVVSLPEPTSPSSPPSSSSSGSSSGGGGTSGISSSNLGSSGSSPTSKVSIKSNETAIITNTINITIPVDNKTNQTTQQPESKPITGFVTLIRPESYPLISVLIIVPILSLIYFIKKSWKTRK